MDDRPGSSIKKTGAAYWPIQLPRSLPRPRTTLAYNLEVSAHRFGDRTAIGFFGRDISYTTLNQQVDRLAAWLRGPAGVAKGDRVALFMQNSPQWITAHFAVLRADAVVVPINPMNKAQELALMLRDSGAKVVICAQDLAPLAVDACGSGTDVQQIVVAAYSDYLPEDTDFALPDWLAEPARPLSGCVAWADALAYEGSAVEPTAQPDDLALLPYTSGSTGRPKACMHTHATFMHTVAGLSLWQGQTAATVFMGLQPMYQVAGLANGVNSPVYVGGTVIPLPRWDRRLAAQLIRRYGVSYAPLAPTAVADLLDDPALDLSDLASIRRITSGGAAMPAEIWRRAEAALGLPFIEAYGMSEAGTTHINPVNRPKPQCLGVPFFDTQSRIIDAATGAVQPPGEAGEIVVRGPQVFGGYWNAPQETAAAFIELEDGAYYRTGDIGMVDDEGYVFMVDRLKRMINAAGFKVWPNEVETKLHDHPQVLEACVISSPDPRRGETVKALVVLRSGAGDARAEDIVRWAQDHMAAYKYPRIVEFVDRLPKSPMGKVLWRELQDAENKKAAGV